MPTLTLKTTFYTKNFPITAEQMLTLADDSTTKKELASASLFKEITNIDINDFVCVERGKWEVNF